MLERAGSIEVTIAFAPPPGGRVAVYAATGTSTSPVAVRAAVEGPATAAFDKVPPGWSDVLVEVPSDPARVGSGVRTIEVHAGETTKIVLDEEEPEPAIVSGMVVSSTALAVHGAAGARGRPRTVQITPSSGAAKRGEKPRMLRLEDRATGGTSGGFTYGWGPISLVPGRYRLEYLGFPYFEDYVLESGCQEIRLELPPLATRSLRFVDASSGSSVTVKWVGWAWADPHGAQAPSTYFGGSHGTATARVALPSGRIHLNVEAGGYASPKEVLRLTGADVEVVVPLDPIATILLSLVNEDGPVRIGVGGWLEGLRLTRLEGTPIPTRAMRLFQGPDRASAAISVAGEGPCFLLVPPYNGHGFGTRIIDLEVGETTTVELRLPGD